MTETHRSVCRMCHGGCGAILTVRDGDLVSVQGDKESPYNRGALCPKGMATVELVNHPDRLLGPLKRLHGRGDGKWQPLTWAEALDEITERIESIRRESEPWSIALGQGTGRHHYMRTVRFANQLGTPNWYEPGLAHCFIPRVTVSRYTYGSFVVGDYYGDTPPRCILFWGHNPVVTGPDGQLMFPTRRALESAEVTIAVDPRRSETAERCDHWIALRPGTDAALALAMIHVIISEDLFDKEFVRQWTCGFEDLAEHVHECTPEWAEKITWVPADRIREVARLYATVKPGVLGWGVAVEQAGNVLQTVRALALLRGITGNVDVPGGDVFGSEGLKPYPTGREFLPRESAAMRLGAQDFRLLGGSRAFMPSAHIPSLFRAIRHHDPCPVRALLVFGGNPLTTVADSRAVKEALLELNLLVVTDLFMTPTAELADYVLPAAAWPEVNDLVAIPYVAPRSVMAQRAVISRGEARQDEWIMDEMAKRLNLPGSDKGYLSLFDEQLSDVGVTFDQLAERGPIYFPKTYHSYRAKGFRTPSRKVELRCKALERLAYDPLPTFHEPTNFRQVSDEYPYILVSGSRRIEYFHSEGRGLPSLRKRRPDPTVEVHGDTAAELGIRDGDWVEIRTPRGRIRQKAHVTEDIHPHVVSADHGWWFPEDPGPDHGVWESNANVLTSQAPPYDPAFGSYVLRGLPCAIRRALEEESKS